ncbi:tetratricopeptide (TPR) repeat protein [Chitinophaga terrae (ex Kim and Jung 2007)]|uniref:tetratricopeptide repeat protein n=1 Tax=Chitinophaga terrae (ex Kim and Jung 2007) TaxID=408074 RepID=UPI0027860D97|nr:tetratricopeptide repeat protein [Chitinophaga terrae (ex Kim and Jung 2007)]MDQ0106360.1 tetratricopeptide (TPR) repeat protein [Chitinophaga terrae (ex Kim and Jung 2007)]
MKHLLVSLLFCTAATTAMAQRAKVASADENLKKQDLEKAKADIDAALQNDKTKNDAKTWLVNGKILEAMGTKQKSGALAREAFASFKKALELDPKMKEAVLEMNQPLFNVYATIANVGYANLNEQKWDSSLINFKDAFEVADFYNSKNLGGTIPTDTALTFYVGYAASQAGKKDDAFTYLKKAADLQFKGEPALYVLLGQLYEEKGDQANWLKTIEEAKTIFPKDKRFNDMELAYYSKTGKTNELLSMLEKKMAENPNDEAMVLDYAIRVDNIANPRDEKGNDAPKPANYEELMGKAETAYKKALELNPNDATANFQLGALYFNRAVVFNKELNALDSKQQTSPKAKELQTKVEGLMNQALPYFEKADAGFSSKGNLEASDKQTYESCLYALQKIYAIKNNNAKVEEMKKKLDALQK